MKTREKPYTPISFIEVEKSAKSFARIIESKLQDLTKILVKYESYEVINDEIARTLDLLKNLEENKKYFKFRISTIASFLPRNQPLYAFTCFVVVPSLMASKVYFRIPQSMKGFFGEMLELLEISTLFPNIIVSSSERLDFLKNQSALLVNPKTKETKPVTDVVIFTGTPAHADKLRTIFDKRTLFVTNGAGHNPVVVSKDADITKAVEAVLALQFYNQGQDCAAPNAILVHKSIIGDFLNLLRKKIRDIKVGYYEDKMCRIGPISDFHDLTRIQDFLVENHKWLDLSTPGVIRTKDAIVEPTIISKPLIQGGNYREIFAPIIFVQEYTSDRELKLYFENMAYARNAMYVTLYGTNSYIKNLINKPIMGKILHDKSTFLHNNHLHAMGMERGTKPYGGYGYGASSLSINGKITPMPTLPQRDIYRLVALPLFRKKRNIDEFTEIQKINVEKILKLHSLKMSEQPNTDKIPGEFYIDTQVAKRTSARYIKINNKKAFRLLRYPNIEYIRTLNQADIKLVHNLRELLKRKHIISTSKFNSCLYSIPKKDGNIKSNYLTNQRTFFRHIYQLLFGHKSGPRLADFLLNVEYRLIDKLLDV